MAMATSMLVGLAMGASLQTVVSDYFVKPSWFTPSIGFDISYVTLTGKWAADLDMTIYKVTPSNTYYVTSTGSGTGTETSPYGKIRDAINAGNATGLPYEVRVAAGEFHKDRPWDVTPTENCNIISTGGTVYISSYAIKSFTLHSGNVYKTNRSLTGAIIDKNNIDSNGNAQRFEEVDALVDVAPGKYYFDAATNDVYLETFDSRDLSSSNAGIRVLVSVDPPRVHGGVNVYLEGFVFEGFDSSSFECRSDGAGKNPSLYLNDVGFKYSTEGNGLTFLGGLCIGKNIVTAKNWLDGMNYHERDGQVPSATEINGLYYDDGFSGAVNTNSSTMHDGGNALRVNCFGTGAGRIFHDVDASVSLLIGCSWGGSRSTGAENSVGAMSGTTSGDATVMGLYFCDNSLSTCETDWYCHVGSTMYINNALRDSSKSVRNGRVVHV